MAPGWDKKPWMELRMPAAARTVPITPEIAVVNWLFCSSCPSRTDSDNPPE